jgi:hypothetical protein
MGFSQLRSTLKLPKSSQPVVSAHGAGRARPIPATSPAARRSGASAAGLQELLEQSLWPMVASAFSDADDHVDVRFFHLADLQLVISRSPASPEARRQAERRVTLEVWPSAGPRLLEVEWSGRRPYVVHRRNGDWLTRLIAAARQVR